MSAVLGLRRVEADDDNKTESASLANRRLLVLKTQKNVSDATGVVQNSPFNSQRCGRPRGYAEQA